VISEKQTNQQPLTPNPYPLITELPCVILSGGRSSRMGEDKSLLPFDGYSTLIEYQYKKLSQIFSNVYISSKIDKFDFLEDKDHIIYDSSDISSPMVALSSIFKKLSSIKNIFIITVDTPLVLIDTIEKLIDNHNGYDITIATSEDKIHNLCGVFNCSIIDNIDDCISNDNHRINYLVRNSKTNYKDFEYSKQFLNINTKDDYLLAQLK